MGTANLPVVPGRELRRAASPHHRKSHTSTLVRRSSQGRAWRGRGWRRLDSIA